MRACVCFFSAFLDLEYGSNDDGVLRTIFLYMCIFLSQFIYIYPHKGAVVYYSILLKYKQNFFKCVNVRGVGEAHQICFMIKIGRVKNL